MIIFSLTGFAQSGQKWAADGNAAGNSDFIGTTNNVSLKFKVNNALALTIEPGGKVKINSLAGGEGIVRYDTYGTLSPIPFNGDQNMVLLGNGHWGTVPIPENYWKIDPTTNHLYTLTPGNVGIGTQTPVMKLDVNGDAVVRGYLYVNNGVIIGKKIDSKSIYSDTLEVSERIRANELTSKTMYSDSLDALKVNVENLAASKEARIGSGLVLDGVYSQIFSNSGLIDFKNTNLTTTGDITANRINATAFHVDTFSVSNVNTTGDIITTGNIYARRIYAEKSVSVGNFTFKNGGTVIGPGKDTIKTENRMAIVSEANSIRMVSDTVIMSDRVAIGREYAEYSLDVAGNARFQDKLIVEGGLIIGKEYQGEKGEIDSLVSKEASIDTVRSENIRATEVNASDRINIGSGNTIRIDGLNSQITSTTGKIDFGSNELRTSGPITGGAFNVGTGNFEELNVTRKIQVGTGTLVLENDPNGLANSIYTDNGTLFLQSSPNHIFNTVINGNGGKVAVGDVAIDGNSEKLTVAGNIMIKGNNGFANNNDEATLFLGDNNHYFKSIHGGGLRIGTFQAPDAIMLMQANGFVGIGTESPVAKMHISRNDNDPIFAKIQNLNGYLDIGFNGVHGIINSSDALMINWVSGKDVVIGGGGIGTYWNLPEQGNLIALYDAIVKRNLFVGAKIYANEIEVIVNVPFPDYVFADNYNLMSLWELKKYIDDNKKLPRMPAAEEVRENGMELSKMTILLLEKVEELSLYIISLNNKIEKIEKSIEINKMEE